MGDPIIKEELCSRDTCSHKIKTQPRSYVMLGLQILKNEVDLTLYFKHSNLISMYSFPSDVVARPLKSVVSTNMEMRVTIHLTLAYVP
jgi:hypothetical protein